jgi:hypothetical protein
VAEQYKEQYADNDEYYIIISEYDCLDKWVSTHFFLMDLFGVPKAILVSCFPPSSRA